MWRLVTSEEYEKRLKKLANKKPQQAKPVLRNLNTLLAVLNTGKKLRPLPCGFLKDEGLRILRISEAGAESNVAATRIYVYPDATQEILNVLTVGDKRSQHDDIARCKYTVKQMLDEQSKGAEDDVDDEADGDEAEGEEDDSGSEDPHPEGETA